jgi:hypothetical protein
MRREMREELSILRHQVARHEIQSMNIENSLADRVQKLEKENRELREQVRMHDRQYRKNNVMIFGIPEPETGSEACSDTVKNVCEAAEVDIGENVIQDAFRVGQKKGRRPLLCKLSSFNKKRELIIKSKQLEGISVMNDLSQEDRKDLKILQSHADRARRAGKRAIIRGGKLIVNEVEYKKSDLEGICGNPASAGPLDEREEQPAAAESAPETQTSGPARSGEKDCSPSPQPQSDSVNQKDWAQQIELIVKEVYRKNRGETLEPPATPVSSAPPPPPEERQPPCEETPPSRTPAKMQQHRAAYVSAARSSSAAQRARRHALSLQQRGADPDGVSPTPSPSAVLKNGKVHSPTPEQVCHVADESGSNSVRKKSRKK